MKKQAKPEVLNEKTEGVKRKLIWKSDVSEDFQKFLELYKEDRKKARIVYFHSNDDLAAYNQYNQYNRFNTRGFSFQQLIMFEKDNGDFTIVLSTIKWGMSITSKMYKSESADSMISYKSRGRKFWLITKSKKGKMLLPLTLSKLHMAFGSKANAVIEELQDRFGWIRYVQENSVAQNTAFNTIIRNRIFSLESMMRHVYKVPYPIAKKLHAAQAEGSIMRTLGHKKFDTFLRYIDNIENLTEERAKNPLFWDTIRMAMVMDKRVNCSWGDARLKKEHDDWSMEITLTLMDAKNRDMKVAKLYAEFEEFSKYELIKTTREMVREGLVNKHCVASYISKVDNGNCGIFRIDGHTLEVVRELMGGFYGLKMLQFKGYRNEEAPDELKQSVQNMLNHFNEEKKKAYEEETKGNHDHIPAYERIVNRVNDAGYADIHENIRQGNYQDEVDLPF